MLSVRTLVVCATITVLFFGLWLGLPFYNQAASDSKVRDLCAKDGGIQIYETIKLPNERFANQVPVFPGHGLLPPLKDQLRAGDEFFSTIERTPLIEEGIFRPSIWRTQMKLLRVSDNKMLGQAVSYSRVGGDPIGPWHQSSFRCPPDADITTVVKLAFTR
jgi:hypothetical protein